MRHASPRKHLTFPFVRKTTSRLRLGHRVILCRSSLCPHSLSIMTPCPGVHVAV